jgi:predicted DNA-binding transcriptional regulator AlpA
VSQQHREPLPGVSEVVEYFGYKSEQTIYDQRHRGVGVGTLGFRVGKSLKFRWEDIDAWIETQSATSQDAA